MRIYALLFLLGVAAQTAAPGPDVVLRGEIVDAGSGRPLPARIYIQSQDGEWHFPDSVGGTAVAYRKQRQAGSIEMHTTLSAHPFQVALPVGTYTVKVERGKEYLPVTREVAVSTGAEPLKIELTRWIDMAARGWYSGDTHVHRTLDELPNVVAAEDLNVALPLSYWVTKAHTPPTQGDKNTGRNLRPEPIAVDATHVIYPVNTEYEIFTVGGRRHTLGAVFFLGHRTPFDFGAPPVAPIAERARAEGALLDLDKHSWPWSLMLVPVMDVDLFELANNHVWRTRFGFRQWTRDKLPEYMQLETDDEGFTEWGWIDFGFQSYYALLNCGFRMRPTAGTASGVHPVPLGFGRVYVHLPDGFSYKSWMEGLDAGRSFVTTGPMLFVTVNGRAPGRTMQADGADDYRIQGTVESGVPLERVEVVVNGKVARTFKPQPARTEAGGWLSSVDATLTVDSSSWIAVRAFERREDGRIRFAHSSPVHVDVAGRPLRPRRAEVEYLIRRMEEELARNEGVLGKESLDEYREALAAYRALLDDARN